MIIDAHTHGAHGDFLEEMAAVGGEWAKKTINTLLLGRTQERKPHAFNVRLRVEMLDRNGIDLQVVTPFNWMESNRLPGEKETKVAFAKVINNSMARVMEDSKGRLIAAATIPLEAFKQGGRQEMDRAIRTLGLKAVMVPSNILGKPLDSPEFEPFWALAAEMDIPVYIHPVNVANTAGRPYEAEYDLMHNLGWPFETELALCRLVFSGMMERYPTLKVVSHHLGGGLPFFWGRTMETYDPTATQPHAIGKTFPKPLYDYFSRFYYDTAVGGSAPAIRCAYEVFGADHLVFATDAPWGPGTGEARLANYPKIIRSLSFSEVENKKIFEENARKMLNL